MLSRFMSSKICKRTSSMGKRYFNELRTLAKISSPLHSYPQENCKLEDNDIIISSNCENDNFLMSYAINCLESCRKPDTMEPKRKEGRIIRENRIPSQLESLSNKNIKKIVLCRDPKECPLYSHKVDLTNKDSIRNYLFLGYTPYLFIVEWYKYLNSNPNNDEILFLFYEDFINNKHQAFTVLADHLNIEIDEDLIDNINIENLFNNNNNNNELLDDELNEECDNYWRNYVEYHIGSRFINYEWFRFICSPCYY